MEDYYQRLVDLDRYGRTALGLRSHRRVTRTARGLARLARLAAGLILTLVLAGRVR